MILMPKSRPGGDGAAPETSFAFAASDGSVKTSPRPKSQPEIAAAKRELLRDFVHEAAQGAADYATAIQTFAAADDAPGLKYSTAKFVAFAREVARGCREPRIEIGINVTDRCRPFGAQTGGVP